MQATVKSVGGQFYTYAVRKGNAPVPATPAIVAPDVQRAALAAVLDTLSPESLAVPERVLALLQPRSEAFGGFNTEMFPRRTGLTFDPVSAATIASDMAISPLLHHERAARLGRVPRARREEPWAARGHHGDPREAEACGEPSRMTAALVQRAAQQVFLSD